MVQVVNAQGGIAGRLGKGFGKGLSEQLPKEIERTRLSHGLQQLGQNAENLTPLQQYAAIAGLPGITPAHLQALPEILKQQNVRSAFTKGLKGSESAQPNESPKEARRTLKDIQFAQDERKGITPELKKGERVSDFLNEEEKANANATTPNRNPLSPELVPRNPWTPDKRNEEIGKLFEQIPGLTLPEARELAAENEQRELAQPKIEREKDAFYEGVRQKADQEFDRQLEIKLQKKGAETFADLPGEMQLNLKRGMVNDLIKDPSLSKGGEELEKRTIDRVANKWTEIGLNNAKAYTALKTLAGSSYLDNSPSTFLQKLRSLQVPYAKAGNKESFKDAMISDFDFSPQRASQLAYPPSSKALSEYEGNIKRSPAIGERFREISRKRAKDIQNIITSEDSLLSIARSIKDKDPYFDETSFFDQLREDRENLSLTPRQERELGQSESRFLPKWHDIWYFPSSLGIETGPVEKIKREK
jgi:hypothetical protein